MTLGNYEEIARVAWRADAVISDRLRVVLDAIGELMGVTLGQTARPQTR